MKQTADIRMVRLLTKAHDWFKQLTSGEGQSIQSISDHEKVTRCYVSRIIQLAFFSPDIVRAILEAKQPPMLTADKLMRCLPLPIEWQSQRKHLGLD